VVLGEAFDLDHKVRHRCPFLWCLPAGALVLLRLPVQRVAPGNSGSRAVIPVGLRLPTTAPAGLSSSGAAQIPETPAPAACDLSSRGHSWLYIPSDSTRRGSCPSRR